MPADMELQGQSLLAPLTTLGLGGRAEFFVDIRSVSELVELRSHALKLGLPLTVLGGGSNALIPDHTIAGVVFRYLASGISVLHDTGESVLIDAKAGLAWDGLVEWSVKQGLWGLECLSGIPGWVGAAPIQNIGAYGAELADVLVSIDVFDTKDAEVIRLPATELGLGYRESHLKRAWRGRYVVLAIQLQLSRQACPNLSYRDLRSLAESEREPTLSEIRARVLEIRTHKSMVADPNDPNAQSLGSFFVNPVIDAAALAHIEKVAAERASGEVPRHQVERGWKVPAGWLIEQSGFKRGSQFGAVGISEKHALALVHHGGGTTAELLDLATRIQEQCLQVYGVQLEREPQPLAPLQLE